MAGDPADVGGAPVDVAVVIVEHVLMRHRREHEIAARGVQHALGLAGGARRIENEQRVFRVHVLDRAFGRHHLGGFVVPEVARRVHIDGSAGALDHDHPVDAAALFDRGIDIGFQRNLPAAAQALVGGDDDLGLAVGDALREAVRREAGEHHGVNGADPRAGQHRVGRLRDHRQIDGDAVALLDVSGAQDVGHLADFVVQLAVGDVLGLRGIVAFPDDRGLVAARVEMPVDAVPGDVEDAVLEPFDRDVPGRVGDVLDLVERLDPVDAPGLFAPEAVGILDRAVIHLAVLGVVDKGALGPFRGHIVDLLGHLSLHSSRCRRRPQAVLIVTMIMRRGALPGQGGNVCDLGRAVRRQPCS